MIGKAETAKKTSNRRLKTRNPAGQSQAPWDAASSFNAARKNSVEETF
jgi:hypothetical protein